MKNDKLSFFKSLEKKITEIPVSEIMVRDIKTVQDNATVKEAIDIMAQHSISGLLITNEKEYPTGIVSEGDLIKKVFHKNKNPEKIKVSEIMSRHLFTIKPTLNIGETGVLMKKHGVSKLPVVEGDKLVGYVTKADLLEEMNELYQQNTRLKWMPAIFMVLLIIIAVLVVVLLKAK